MQKPSFILDIPADKYHADAKDLLYLSSHQLGVYRRCPLEFKQRFIDHIIPDADSPALAFGRACHVLILEGESKFHEEFQVSDGPVNPKTGAPYGKTTKAYLDWAATQEKAIVSSEEYDQIVHMHDSVSSHIHAKKLLECGFAEGTVRATWHDIPCQSRMDWFNPDTGDLVDLKTCQDIDMFTRDIRAYGYLFQLAFYARLLRIAGWKGPIAVSFIGVEKKPPYRCAVVRVNTTTLAAYDDYHEVSDFDNRHDDNETMMIEYASSIETGSWPTRYEDIKLI